MNMEEYIKYVSHVMNDKQISEEEICGYLYILEVLLKLTDESSLIDYEERSYTVDGRTLTDKERICYELSEILSEDETEVIRKLLYRLKRKNKESIDEIKKLITKLQIRKGHKPRFYSIFRQIIEEEFKKYNESEDASGIGNQKTKK